MNLRRVVVICSLVAIAFGMLARLSHLDTKLFWQDEAIAALRIGGHTVAEYQTLFDGRVHPASQMAAMQRLTPGRGPAATIASIAKEEPQRSPLYYGAARIWAGLFGDGVVSLRAFSAVIGLAGIGLAFGFGSALMRTSLGGYILAALVAVSPFHIRYSQQVREFVLFTDSILLAGWLFVRVLERPTLRRWIAFGLAATFGLYADPQFAFVLAGFGIVALTMSGRVFLGFLTTAAAAFVAYSPWLDVNAHLASRTSLGLAWAASPYSLRSFAVKWAFNLGAVFFDADLAHVWLGFALVPILVLLGYAGLRLLRHHYRPADTIALSLLLCTSVPLMIADFIKHAHYETVARYEVATWVGIETAVAFALTLWLRSESVRSRTFATAAFLYLIVCGSMSAALQSSYVVWWDNNEHVDESAIATAITPPYATVVAERSHGVYVLVISRYLPPQSRLLLVDLDAPQPAVTVPLPAFVLLPTDELRARVGPACGTPPEISVAKRSKFESPECKAGRSVVFENISPQREEVVPRLDGGRDKYGVDPANSLWRLSYARAR